MMRTLDARPLALLGALIFGSAVTLGVMAAAGSSPAVWVAIAGASACACGVVVGSTARVVPAAVLASVAGAALVLAVGGPDRGSRVEVRQLVVAPAEMAEESVVADEPVAASATTVTPTSPPAKPPVTAPQFVRRFYAALGAGRFEQAWSRLGPAIQPAQ
jgi:hypothetical protein